MFKLSINFIFFIFLFNTVLFSESYDFKQVFSDGKTYKIDVNMADQTDDEKKALKPRNGLIRIINDEGIQRGSAKFEIGYVNPIIDTLNKNDSGNLKTFLIQMVDTRSAPPGAGKFLLSYMANLAKAVRLPMALSTAWGSQLFWAKMGFVNLKPGEMIETYPQGKRKPSVPKLSINNFLEETEEDLDAGSAESSSKSMVMPLFMVDQWEMNNDDWRALKFPVLDYAQMYKHFGAEGELADRVAQKLRAFKK